MASCNNGNKPFYLNRCGPSSLTAYGNARDQRNDNSWCVDVFLKEYKIYLHVLSFLDIELTTPFKFFLIGGKTSTLS